MRDMIYPIGWVRPDLLAQVNSEAERRLAALSAAYPDREVASWPQQVKEAEALMINPEAAAPLLAAVATARDIPLSLLAQRVLEKAHAYAVVSGAIIGRRQALEDAIDAAAGDPMALAGIDTSAGWPEVTL